MVVILRVIVMLIAMVLPAASLYAEVTTVATVNGAAITSKDLDAAIDQLIPNVTFHGSLSEAKRGEFREKALEDLVNYELRYQAAVREGMKPDEKRVKEIWDGVRGQYASNKEYRKALEETGLSEDTWRARIEKRVLVDQMTRKIVEGPSRMSDAGLKEYYDKNLSKFMQPESVRIRLITAKEEKKIREALKLIQDGQDFGMTSARMSEDNYRVKGGDRGFMHRGSMVPELESVIFALKAGEMAGPLNIGGVWLLVKLEDKKPGRQIAFEETRESLRKELEANRAKELMEKWIAGLKANAAIKIVPLENAR